MRAISSRLLFCKEGQEQFAHGHSFIKSDESNLLMVATFSRATRVNRTWLLFKMSNFEQKSKEQMIERANFQPFQRVTIQILKSPQLSTTSHIQY